MLKHTRILSQKHLFCLNLVNGEVLWEAVLRILRSVPGTARDEIPRLRREIYSFR
jgi:hypothetical protein